MKKKKNLPWKTFFLSSFHLYLHHPYHIDLAMRKISEYEEVFSFCQRLPFIVLCCLLHGVPMFRQIHLYVVVVAVQSLSCVWLFVTPWTAAYKTVLSFTISRSLLKFMYLESMMPSNYLILCTPFSFCLQSFPAPGTFLMSQLFPSAGQSIGASASSSVLPMNIQGWFRIDWFDLLAVQRTLKSLLQYHSSKASILQCSAFFMVQLSYPHMTTGKIIALTIWIFVSKVLPLLFNMLSGFVIALFPRSKYLLISWLQSLSTLILEPKKIRSVLASNFTPIYLPWSNGTRCHFLSFFNVEIKPTFSLSFTFIKRLFNSSSFSAIYLHTAP